MQIPKLAALYCRISKSDYAHDESNSIANQKVMLERTAAQHGFEHTQFFVDDGYSGTVFDRPTLKRLEDAIKADRISAVVVKDISRLSRDYLKVGHYLEKLFPQHNVRFISVGGGIDSNTNSTDFLPLYSVMDEWYAKDISRKIRMMYQSRASSGVPIGQPVYGYIKASDHNKFWTVDTETAEVVRYIYQLAFQGYGSEQIAGILENAKILTPSYYRQTNGGKRMPKSATPYRWAASTVAKILRSQKYCGDIVNLKTYSNSYKDKKRHESPREKMAILRNVHEPIIERSFWEYIQSKLNNLKSRKRAGKQSLFSGFLRCGDCGSNLHYHFNQTNPSIEYYNCFNYTGNRGTCPDTHYVRLDNLTEWVRCEINQLIASSKEKSFWDTVSEQKSIDASQQIEAMTSEAQMAAKRQGELSKLLTLAYEDKVKGVIDDETFTLLVSGFKKERDQLRLQNQQIQEKLEAARNFQNGLDYFQELISEQAPITELTRDIVGQFIDWIAVYPADRSVRPYRQRIGIYYHFVGRIGASKKFCHSQPDCECSYSTF